MAEGDNKKIKRDTKSKAAHSANDAPSEGDPSHGGFEEDTFGDEGFRQEGGTTHGTRRHRAQTLIIVGAIVLGTAGLAASFLLRDAATPAPNRVTPGATLFVTVGPTRTPSPPATPQPAPTFAPIDIQRADTPRQMLREIPLADEQIGTNLNQKHAGVYSYDGRHLATIEDAAPDTALKITNGPQGPETEFNLPFKADANPQIYAWSPDNRGLLVTAGLSSTAGVTGQMALVYWDSNDEKIDYKIIPISTTLDALTLGLVDKNNLDDVARTALAYWSPDGSRLAVIADAVLDDPSYNPDGSPRFRKLIQLFDRTGAPLGQFETSSDCCYWTPGNELMWWDARDPNAPEYVFHSLATLQPIADMAQSTVHTTVPISYSPNGLWVIASFPQQLLAVEPGTSRRLVRIDLGQGKVVPLLDRLEQVTAAFTYPDLPVTALRFTRTGADNTLWFYGWVSGALMAGGQVQQLGSWDTQLRGFIAVSAGSNPGTAQVELVDAPSAQAQLDFTNPPQRLRAETSVLRPWLGNDLGRTNLTMPMTNVRLLSPDGRWRAELSIAPDALAARLDPVQWANWPVDNPIAEWVFETMVTPTLTFTQSFRVADGMPALHQWAPDSKAFAVTTITGTATRQAAVVLQLPADSDGELTSTQIDLSAESDPAGQPAFFPVWSQDGTELIDGSDTLMHVLNREGEELERIVREPGDAQPMHLSNHLLLMTQNETLQTLNLRDPELTRQAIYTWTPSVSLNPMLVPDVRHDILGVNADGTEVLIFEMDSAENRQAAIKRLSLESGEIHTVVKWDIQPQFEVFSTGPDDQPLLAISLRDQTRVLDARIWFYDWRTDLLYAYDRPAKLLGWDSASKSFLLAKRSADGFQVEAMQPLIQ